GTTYEDTRKLTIDKIEERIGDTFREYEIRRAFTAHRIINVLKLRDGVFVDTPEEALNKLMVEGFEEVIVQPLHLIPGEEYQYVMKVVENFKKSFKKISAGRPALFFKGFENQLPDDYEILVKSIETIIPNRGITVFMGHGSAHSANACYSCLQLVLQDRGFNNVYIANVEGYPDIQNVISKIKISQTVEAKKKEVTLIPLMLVSGDHARNDMAGEEEDSFKNLLLKAGFKVNLYLHGLGELQDFQDIYLKHIEDVIEDRYEGCGKTRKGDI
ncbi:MAG: sirohydrochlorin cobaltochelatase, partial [Clostridiaceae bacterium]|nr:sirohydrochlorin cobaltochelatase [Clostridiaceae bacterium]